MEVNKPSVEKPVDIIPRREDVPAPPALFAKKLDVLEVKRDVVLSAVDQSWRNPLE